MKTIDPKDIKLGPQILSGSEDTAALSGREHKKADIGHRRLDRNGFPNQPTPGSSQVPGTIDNLQHLLTEHGIDVHWNVIRKRLTVCTSEGPEETTNSVVSLCALNGFPTANLYSFLFEIGRAAPSNPIKDWILSSKWDGQDRLQDFYDTVLPTDDYDPELKEALLRRWLLSATAAALKKSGFKTRGVLTLQGPQGVGKTSWINALLPDGTLRNNSIKLDHHLDGGNKDSVIVAVEHWIVEIGELESSFKKDVARLKGFLTRDCDKLRPPYARSVEEYPRRTVFAATVNDERFLVDQTGNSRWWTIAIKGLNFRHDIDQQQLFAQLAEIFESGEQWWLTPSEEAKLADWNKRHRAESVTAERVRDYLDRHERVGKRYNVTASKMLDIIGIRSPSNMQCKECGAVLRELLGPPKRIQGRDRWAVPIMDVTKIDPEPPVY